MPSGNDDDFEGEIPAEVLDFANELEQQQRALNINSRGKITTVCLSLMLTHR